MLLKRQNSFWPGDASSCQVLISLWCYFAEAQRRTVSAERRHENNEMWVGQWQRKSGGLCETCKWLHSHPYQKWRTPGSGQWQFLFPYVQIWSNRQRCLLLMQSFWPVPQKRWGSILIPSQNSLFPVRKSWFVLLLHSKRLNDTLYVKKHTAVAKFPNAQ